MKVNVPAGIARKVARELAASNDEELSAFGSALERTASKFNPDAASGRLTVDELDAVIETLEDEHTLPERPQLVDAAVPKLRALRDKTAEQGAALRNG
jgi:hypothetical protein